MKEKQDQDPVLLQLKEDVHKKKVMTFAKGGDGVLRYQGRLCVPDVDNVRERDIAEFVEVKVHLLDKSPERCCMTILRWQRSSVG